MTRLAVLLAIVVTLWCALASGMQASALPTPIPHPSQTLPPDVAQPSPTPLPLVITGRLIDFERGYVVFASGDAFRLAPNAQIVDATSGAAPAFRPGSGNYASISLDPASATVALVRVSHAPIAGGTPPANVPRALVAQASSPQPNPDLEAPKIPAQYQSKLSTAVLVDLTVRVPSNTPYTDDVYIATDSSGWNAQAIKMQRVDGLHYHVQVRLRGGTTFRYLFTRGSWRSVERDRSGLERAPRTLSVLGGDSQVVEATVYRWADIP